MCIISYLIKFLTFYCSNDEIFNSREIIEVRPTTAEELIAHLPEELENLFSINKSAVYDVVKQFLESKKDEMKNVLSPTPVAMTSSSSSVMPGE
jgi:hypothetical protein